MGVDDHGGRLAAAARALYVFHFRLHQERATGVASRYGAGPMPAWDGGRDRAGRTHKPVWPRIVAVAAANGADLSEFVAAQFDPRREPPRPNQLLSTDAVARWRAVRGDASGERAAQLEAQHNHFAVAVAARQSIFGRGPAAAARGVLRDRTAALSALYRYCVAARTGEDEIAAEFRPAALGQLVSGPAGYVAGWRGFLPDELASEAGAIVAKLAGEGGR